MGETLKILRVFIDGDWFADDMVKLISGLDEFYSDLVLADVIGGLQELRRQGSANRIEIDARIQELANAVSRSAPKTSRAFLRGDPFEMEMSHGFTKPFALEVVRISYGSAGSWDLLGIGKVFDSMTQAIALWSPKARAEAAKLRAEAEKLKAEAALPTADIAVKNADAKVKEAEAKLKEMEAKLKQVEMEAKQAEVQDKNLKNLETMTALLEKSGTPQHVIQEISEKHVMLLGYDIPELMASGKLPSEPKVLAQENRKALPPPTPSN